MTKSHNSSIGITRCDLLKYGYCCVLTGVLLSSLLFGGCDKKQPQPEKTNIILITVDTLRADHLGCYGYFRNTSPNIDKFARDGLLFENCLSHAPETRLSFSSIFTGFFPHETQNMETLSLPAKVDTIAEILKRKGYTTVAVVSNYLLKKGRGWEQGFDIYDDTMNERELVRRWPERTAGPTTARAIELFTQFHQSKLFMWIHYQDPHGPYTPPGDFARLFLDAGQKPYNIKMNNSLSGIGGIPAYQRLESNRNFYYYVSQYDGEIRYQDEQFKLLINALKRKDLYNNSLIMFSSDHGEGMGEHNYFFAHGESLYANQTHVPLILKYGNSLSGRRKDFVQQIDIVPTILNILGDKPDSRFRGRDLRSRNGKEKEIFAEMRSPLDGNNIRFSIVLDGLKLIFSQFHRQYELFDLESDPHEKNNLIEDKRYRMQTHDLKMRLDRIRKEDLLKLGETIKPPKLSKEEIRNLKSLGYVR